MCVRSKTMNWRGRPLTSHEVIVQSIAATTSRAGLCVMAELDTNAYPTGVAVDDAEIAALSLARHIFHGEWNYALHSRTCPAIPVARPPQPPARAWDRSLRSDPALTGMTREQLSDLTQSLSDGDVKRGRPPRLEFSEQVLAAKLGFQPRTMNPTTRSRRRVIDLQALSQQALWAHSHRPTATSTSACSSCCWTGFSTASGV